MSSLMCISCGGRSVPESIMKPCEKYKSKCSERGECHSCGVKPCISCGTVTCRPCGITRCIECNAYIRVCISCGLREACDWCLSKGKTPDTKPVEEPECTCSVCTRRLHVFTYKFEETLRSLFVGYQFREVIRKFEIDRLKTSRDKDIHNFMINGTTEQLIELAYASNEVLFKMLCKYVWLMTRVDDVDKAKTFVKKIAKIPNPQIVDYITDYTFTFEIAHIPKYRKYFSISPYSDKIPLFSPSRIQMRGRDAATLLYQFPTTPDNWFKIDSYGTRSDYVGTEGIKLVKKFREHMIMGDDGYVTVNTDGLTIGIICKMLDEIAAYTLHPDHIPLQLINAFGVPLLLGTTYFVKMPLIALFIVFGDLTVYSECLKKTPGWTKVLFALWEKNEKISCYQIFDIMCQPYTIEPEQPAKHSVLTRIVSICRNVVARFRRS